MQRLIAVFLFVAAAACGGPVRGTAPGHVAPWLRADRQRCLIPRDLRENMEAMARRCAEAWVREEDDVAAWPRVLTRRSGTLASHASSEQCSVRECVVLFRVLRPMLTCA